MAFVETSKDGYRFYVDQRFPGIEDWLLKSLHQKDPLHRSRRSEVWKARHPEFGEFFFKSFDTKGLWPAAKNIFRGSGAFRAWKAGEMLRGKGFHAPEVLAVGEKRGCSFLVTFPLKGTSLKDIFTSLHFKEKRNALRQIGREIGRLHRLNILHGDLLPGNIFVVKEGDSYRISLLDNESTRIVPSIGIDRRVKNLVQLNRVVIPGITASDRVRFFDAYLEENPSIKPGRETILRRVGEITAERVMRHRGIPPEKREDITFRALMAWEKSDEQRVVSNE